MSEANYENLYMTILRIGQSRLETGISYKDLIKELKQRGFDLKDNDCIQRATEHWFLTSFHHVELHEQKGGRHIYHNFKDHLDCNFILNGEACLQLLQYDNMIQATILSNNAVKVANRGIKATYISVIVAIIIGVVAWILTYMGIKK